MELLPESYEQTVENQVQDLRDHLGHLTRKSKTARGRTMNELDWRLQWLERKLDQIQTRLHALKTAKKPQWAVLRREIEDLMENLKKALESASNQLL
jgi:predicted RNase H-like nuclease (RuvC/YqgF family)